MERSPGFAHGVGRWKFRIGPFFAVTVPIAFVATIAGTKDAPAATGAADAPILLVDGDETIPVPTVDEIARLGG